MFLALYALAIFWKCLRTELEPFGVGAKFVCVKGVIFFSFWQGLSISLLVSLGLIKHVGSVVDDEYLSPALQDTLISLEMPIFAIAQIYAFTYRDYLPHPRLHAARLPVLYALRDSAGIKDLLSDFTETFSGAGYTYRTWEASDDIVAHPFARERRGRAGLRYTDGGRQKYWMEEGPLAASIRSDDPNSSLRVSGSDTESTPLRSYVPPDPFYSSTSASGTESTPLDEPAETDHEALQFDDLSEADERLYETSRKLPCGDYMYSCMNS